MEKEYSLSRALWDVLENLMNSVADFVPRLLTAVLVIIVGLIVAKIVERLIRIAFERLRLNEGLERIGASQMLQKLGLRDAPGRILSRTIYFLLIILFTQSVTRAVGLHAIADAIGAFFSYLPNLVAAFLVLFLGMIVAQFLGKTVTRSAEEAGIEIAGLLGRLLSSLIIFIVVLMAISQLKVDTQIIRSVVLVLLGGVAIAFALSFGLGTRDVTRNMVAGFYARKLFRSGDQVELGGESGTLIVISPIQTLIERDDRQIAIPNRVFLDEVVRQ